MVSEFAENFKKYQEKITYYIDHFDEEGTILFKKRRNTLKLFDLDGQKIVIKSYKVPNLINRVVYRYFRKGKARRAFEYAFLLSENEIKTPASVAYFQESDQPFFGKSYYACLYQPYDFTFQRLIDDKEMPDREEILTQFTRFTYKLHERGFEFLDHGPGNTLIRKVGDKKYEFYLVDINQMRFHKAMDYEIRIRNFSKLTTSKEIIAVMSREYAKLTGREEDAVYADMCRAAQKFQDKRRRKHIMKMSRLKRLIKGRKQTDFYKLVD